MCMLTNSDTDLKCKACQTLKPGVKPEDVKEEIKEEKTEAAKSSFSFGMSSVAGLNDSKAGFGDIKPSSTFSFGAKGDSGDVKGGFSFGVKKIEEKPDKAAEEKPALSFGSATGSKRALETTEEVKPAEAKPAFNFGAPAKEETTKPAFGSLTSDTAPKFNFGGNKAENKTETTAAPAFNFGGTGTATTTTTPAFNFGGNTPTTGSTEAKPAAGFSFGGAAPSSTTPSTGLNFGGTTTTTTAAAPAFNFGGPKPASVSLYSYNLNPSYCNDLFGLLIILFCTRCF